MIIPTPAALGSLCGFAVRVPIDQRGPALMHMIEAGIEPDAEIEMGDRV